MELRKLENFEYTSRAKLVTDMLLDMPDGRQEINVYGDICMIACVVLARKNDQLWVHRFKSQQFPTPARKFDKLKLVKRFERQAIKKALADVEKGTPAGEVPFVRELRAETRVEGV